MNSMELQEYIRSHYKGTIIPNYVNELIHRIFVDRETFNKLSINEIVTNIYNLSTIDDTLHWLNYRTFESLCINLTVLDKGFYVRGDKKYINILNKSKFFSHIYQNELFNEMVKLI